MIGSYVVHKLSDYNNKYKLDLQYFHLPFLSNLKNDYSMILNIPDIII